MSVLLYSKRNFVVGIKKRILRWVNDLGMPNLITRVLCKRQAGNQREEKDDVIMEAEMSGGGMKEWRSAGIL